MELTYAQADKLCYHSANFTFSDPLKSAVALTNAYLYQDGYNSFYINEFANLTSYETTNFYDDFSPFKVYFDEIQWDVRDYYEEANICNSNLGLDKCAFSNLTYS